MEQPTKFATPAEEAVTMDNQGRMRVTMDPVSETDADLFSAGAETREPGTAPVEAEPNQRMPSLAHPFVTLAEDAIDADAEYGKYLLASQLRSIGVEPFPEPTQSPDDMMLAGPSGEAQSDGRSISGQVLQAGFKGLDQGGRELMDSFAFLAGAPVEAAKNVMNVGLEAVGMEPIKNAFGDIDSMRTIVGAYQNAVDEAIPVPESVRDWASQPYDNEILGGLVEGITQFGVAAVPAAKLVKAMTTYNAAARGFVWGAIADFTAFNPDDPTLANGIIDHLQSLPPEEQMPVLQSFLSVMAKHETDSELVKRAKMAYEGAAIGVAIELIAKGAIKVANKIPFQQIADASKRAIGRAGEAADARIAERAADTGVTLRAGVDPMPAVDAAISAAGKAARRDPNDSAGDAMAQAQARYFETGNYEPPTAENPVSIVKPTEQKPGIIAFHGSGADFDEFRLEMVGTGEGAQAYGYGLYFTDSEDIANFYRQTVGGGTGIVDFSIGNLDLVRSGEFRDYSPGAMPFGRDRRYRRVQDLTAEDYAQASMIEDIFINEGRLYNEIKKPGAGVIYEPKKGDELKDELINIINETLNSKDPTDQPGEVAYLQNIVKSVARGDATIKLDTEQYGKTYKVGLAPKPDELLDYDTPLNQQPRVVQKQLENLVGDLLAGEPEHYDRFDYKALAAIRGESPTEGYSPTGDDILTDLQRFLETAPNQTRRAAMDASQLLNDFGIPGIKYRAAGSRGAATTDEAAERNYVIFDDKAVKILEKYGIVGPVAVTAAGVKSSEDEFIENEA